MRDFAGFVRQQVAPLALPPAREQKIVEEWAAQLEEAYEALRASGGSDDDAWRELQRQVPDWQALGGQLLDAEPALLRLANPTRAPLAGGLKQTLATTWRRSLTAGMMRDLQAGLRLLIKDRGFTATIILTLAICLGVNAAIFTVVHSVLLRPLPFPDADRIIGMGDVYPTVTPNDILANDAPSYFDRLQGVTALEEQAMFTFWFDTIVFDRVPEEVRGMRATPSLFRLVRAEPALGRTFTDGEGEIGSDQKIILSHGLWQRLYGGDPAAIGKTLRLGWTGQPYTIVGVMPRDFAFFEHGYDGHGATQGRRVQFWIPLAFTAAQKSDAARTRYGFYHVGRLRPEATVEQVQSQLDAIHAANVKRFPQFRYTDLGMYPLATPLQEALTRNVRRTLYLLWAGAGFVLLIGAINVGHLALARAGARARELATRLALGASRLQVTRQLIVEGLVPAAIGGVAGVGVGFGILQALASTGLANLPNALDIRMDATVIALVGGVAVLVGLVIGLVPAVFVSALTINHVLADGSRLGTSGRTAGLFRRSLVVTQVALSVVLLVAATLLFASFRQLLRVDAGFTPAHVTTATIFPPPSRYPDAPAAAELCNRLLERVRAIAGVEAAGITSNIALSGFASPSTVSTEPPNTAPSNAAPAVPSVVGVTPGYFETMGTRLVRGRYFADSDRPDTLLVAIADERLAARLWPNTDPIGKPIYRGTAGPYTVVGIVREVRFEGLKASDSVGTAYFPHTQAPPLPRLRWIAIKSSVEPAAVVRAVRAALADIDPDLPIADIQTMTERMSGSVVPQRLAMNLATMFAIVALFLSLLGIYGVLAYLVARRTREIGIRMALGSNVRGIFHLVFREGLTLIGAGVLLGLIGAAATAQLLEGQLFGVRPGDPLILGAVTLATGCIALLACVAPAARATRVDPVRVLTDA